jgi:hypothetical protein
VDGGGTETAGRLQGDYVAMSAPGAEANSCGKAIGKIAHYHSALSVSGIVVFLLGKARCPHPLFKSIFPGIRHPPHVRTGTMNRTDE